MSVSQFCKTSKNEITKKQMFSIWHQIKHKDDKVWVLSLESWPVKIPNDPITNKRQIHIIVGELLRSFAHGDSLSEGV